jgi:hypothetical protein
MHSMRPAETTRRHHETVLGYLVSNNTSWHTPVVAGPAWVALDWSLALDAGASVIGCMPPCPVGYGRALPTPGPGRGSSQTEAVPHGSLWRGDELRSLSLLVLRACPPWPRRR